MSSSNIPAKEWTASANKGKHAVEDFKPNHDDAVSGTYGLETKGSRDWNEEIQVCKDLPKDNIYQLIQRDRAFYKIYFDF
jgi:protein TIF31